MLLVSYPFLCFLLLLLVVYYQIPGNSQWLLLLLASCGFCLSGGFTGLVFPMVTTVTTWFLAGQIGKWTAQSKAYIKEQKLDTRQKKEYSQAVKRKQCVLLQIGLILNFGILAVLKYAGVIAADASQRFGIRFPFSSFNWVLPMGISYYTFQAMGYLIDVYRRKYEPERNLAKFSLFVCYFPQLTVGPISRFDQIKEELYAVHRFDGRKVKFGAERMLWGYFKKLVVADRLKLVLQAMADLPEGYHGEYALLKMMGYVFWLYMDFSAGMDMVIGISQLFGISLPENFDHPFSSRTLSEFWRRWHMSLMQWFREYVFFPVSTSQVSRKASDRVRRLFGRRIGDKVPAYLATITVWLVTGIWHGVSWNYIIWGMANGMVILLSQELTKCYRVYRKKVPFTDYPQYQYFERFRTFLLFCFFTSFQYQSVRMAFQAFWSIVTDFHITRLFSRRLADDGNWVSGFAGNGGSAWSEGLLQAGLDWHDGGVLFIGMLLILVVSAAEKSGGIRKRMDRWPATIQYVTWFGLVLFILIAGIYGQGYDASQFIYNQF